MKKQRKHIRRKARSLHGFNLETLEVRNLLAANVLATADDSISTPGGTDTVDMTVALPDSPAGTGVFAIRAIAEDGSGLDPAAPLVRDANGGLMTGTSMDDADGTAGMTVVELGAGDYTLELSGESSTTGAYSVEVSLLGDVGSNDGTVSTFERLRATAAFVQHTGTGNHVTDLLFRQNGIDPTVDQYDAGMDVNMNGHVDPHELGMIEDNASLGTVIVTLQADSDPPVFSGLGLANDTGVSASDSISIDPTINGTVIEQNAVTSIIASLDGGADVDITASLGILAGGGSFTLTPAILDTIAGGPLAGGAHTLRLSATDEAGNETSPPAEFSFTFIDGNVAPTGVGSPATRTEDMTGDISLSARFSDANAGDVLTYSATGVPSWLTLNPTTGRLSGTPTNDDVGSFDIMATATDSQGLTATVTVSVTVVNSNDAPIVQAISPDPQMAFEDTLFSLDIGGLVSDPDTINVPDMVTISVDRAAGVQPNGDPIDLLPLPGWLTFDEVTGVLSGTPTQADVDSLPEFGVLVTAVDEAGASGFDFFMINVEQTPEPPFFIPPIANQEVDQDSAFSLDISDNFDDPDGADTLSFSATLENGSALPTWLFLNASTGVLAGTPSNADVGTLSIVVTATDNTNLTAMSDAFMLTVNDINDAPLIADQTFSVESDAVAGTSVGTVDASDPDAGDTLTFAIIGGTGTNDFEINPTTGQITVATGAMLANQAVLTLEVEVTDSGTPQLSATATMTIAAGNQAPTPVDDDAGAVFDTEFLTISQSDLLSDDTDPDGDTLSFAGVSPTSALGATVTTSGGDIFYDPFSSAELIGLMDGEFRIDTFTYTVSDPGGAIGEATVTVRVDGAQAIAVRLRTFDASGNEVTQITQGGIFELRAFVEDISADPMGIFSAFIDVEYNNNPVVATLNGDLVHADDFDLTTNGTATPGLIDEVGGLSGLEPTGGGEFELFRQEFIASGFPGDTVAFTSNPSDTPGLNGILLFGPDFQLDNVQIDFGGTDLAIVAPSPLSGGGSSLSTNTNPDNAYDVNDDEMISPIDALMVVNHMGGAASTSPGSNAYVDVNADGYTGPLDALMVINRLGNGAVTAPPAPLSGSTSLTDANGTVDSVFADLGNDPSSDFGVPQMGSTSVINPTDLGDAASDEDADDEEAASVDLLLGLE